MHELRVLVVADDPLARAGLATLLASEPGCTVVGRVTAGDELGAALEAYQPDVILWDLGWDAPRQEESLERLAALSDTAPPVVGLVPDDERAGEAWAAGATGLLLRDARPAQLHAALQAAACRLVTLDPALMAARNLARFGERQPPDEALTPRELEVLQLLAEGLSNKAIARRLDVSEHTVKFHVNAILGKLGAQSRTEAVVRATRQGLIAL